MYLLFTTCCPNVDKGGRYIILWSVGHINHSNMSLTTIEEQQIKQKINRQLLHCYFCHRQSLKWLYSSLFQHNIAPTTTTLDKNHARITRRRRNRTVLQCWKTTRSIDITKATLTHKRNDSIIITSKPFDEITLNNSVIDTHGVVRNLRAVSGNCHLWGFSPLWHRWPWHVYISPGKSNTPQAYIHTPYIYGETTLSTQRQSKSH